MADPSKKKEDGEKRTKKRGRDWFDDDLDGPLKRCEPSKTVDTPAETMKSNRGQEGSSSGVQNADLAPAMEEKRVRLRGPLPLRLFPEKKIPGGGRINTYSKPDYLLNLVEILDGTDELDFILDSQFGKLFEIQIRKAVLSGKLVHQFLGRSLRTRKRHEIWFVYGGKPIRFSLKEFGWLTGLKCDQYPNPDPMAPAKVANVKKSAFWTSLIGKRDHCHVADVLDMLRFDKQKPAHEKMSSGRRLRLALIALVEGVLIPQSWSRPVSRECVELAKSIDGFVAYPWGRRSFELTLEMISYRNTTNPTEQSLRDKLAASHLTAKGFIISLQLLILASVPKLREELPENPKWLVNFLEAVVDQPKPLQSLPQLRRYHNENIKAIEIDPELEVVSMFGDGCPLGNADFSWSDEVRDLAVDNMVDKIQNGYRFVNDDWVFGAADKEVQPKGVQPKMSTPDRETVLCLPKTKQLTIRKLLGGKGKEIAEGSTADGSETMDRDRLFMEVRGEIFAAVDMGLARLKSQWPGGNGFGGLSTVATGKELRIVDKIDMKKSVDCLFSSGSGECATPPRVDVTESLAIEKVIGDEIDAQVNEVLVDLAKDESKTEKVLEEELEGPCAIEDSMKVDNEALMKDKGEGDLGDEGLVDTSNVGDKLLTKEQLATETEVNVVIGVMTETTIPDDEKNCVDQLGADEQVNMEIGFGAEPNILEDDSARCVDQAEMDDQVAARKKEKQIIVDELGGAQSTNVEDIGKVDEVDSGSSGGKSGDDTDDEHVDSKATAGENMGMALRSKRERKAPKKFSDDDLLLGNPGGSGEASLSSEEFGSKEEALKRQFVAKVAGYRQSHYDVEGQSLPRTFFRDIYRPKNHVNSEHMEFMLSCVWRRLGRQLVGQRIVILDSWFTQLLKTAHGSYNKGRRADEPFIWNNSLRKYVTGEVGRRPGNVAWLLDVDQIYAPMNLGKNHWVALCICLREGKITIFDSNINLNSDAKIGRLVKHLTEIMPLLVQEVAPVHAALYEPAQKYEHNRPADVSQNARGGDCGPMTVKFIELRAQGLPVDGMTDEDVDNLRMMYAMEVYREFVEPFP